jgi:hypothetical protein
MAGGNDTLALATLALNKASLASNKEQKFCFNYINIHNK